VASYWLNKKLQALPWAVIFDDLSYVYIAELTIDWCRIHWNGGFRTASRSCHPLHQTVISYTDYFPISISRCEFVWCGRAWLEKCPSLLALTLYSYLRVIVDHGGPIFAQLRQREVDFCVSLMRQQVNTRACCLAQIHIWCTAISCILH